MEVLEDGCLMDLAIEWVRAVRVGGSINWSFILQAMDGGEWWSF